MDMSRGSRRPRLEDVAERVGMSPASVSMVLSGAPGPSAATRERVLEAAAELGYRPDRTASLLARRRTHLVGVLMQVGSPFHAELVEDLHEAAEGRGYDVVLSTVTRTRDERRATETLVDFRCEALVLLGPVAPAAQLAALGRQLPVVVIGRRVAGGGVDVVRTADAEGSARSSTTWPGWGTARSPTSTGPGDDRRRPPPRLPRGMRRHGLAGQVRVIAGDHTEAAGSRAARAPGRRRPPRRGGRLQRLLRPRAAGRLQPGRGRGPSGRLGGRLRRQQPGPAGPREPDHGQPGRPRPGRARDGRGRGAPRRCRVRPREVVLLAPPGRPGHHRPPTAYRPAEGLSGPVAPGQGTSR